MKNITKILISLYFIHVLFADFLFDFTKIFKGEYTFNLSERLKSVFALSYVTFLAIALSFEITNNETFFIAFLFSSLSFICFIAYFSHFEDYITQIAKHSLLLLPIIYLYCTEKVNFSFKPTYITYIAIFYLIFVKIISNKIYNI